MLLNAAGGAAIAGSALAGSALAATPLGAMTVDPFAELQPLAGGGRLKQSVCQWCYSNMPLDDLCAAATAPLITGLQVGMVPFLMTPDGVAAANPAFDVTPANLVTGFVTEVGVVKPAELVEKVRDR